MKILIRTVLAVIMAIPAIPSAGSAQFAPGVTVGARIRSSAGTGWQGTGTVLESGSDSVVVTSDATGSPVVLRRANAGRLEIGDGQRRSTRKGLTYGALIGGATGAILGFSGGDQKCTAKYQALGFDCANLKTASEVAVDGTIFMGILGAGVGALTGFLRTSDRWVAVRESRVAVSPILGGGGHLGVSLRF